MTLLTFVAVIGIPWILWCAFKGLRRLLAAVIRVVAGVTIGIILVGLLLDFML